MSGNVVFLPSLGSPYFQDPKASLAAMPASDTTYVIRLAEDTGVLYYFNGASWSTVQAYPILSALSATTPLQYNNSTGVFSIPAAATAQNGYLTSTDWNTFNGKQDLITAGTTAQYYRGDKSFQTLSTAIYALLSAGAPLTFNSSTGAFAIPVATTSVNGYLSSTDWTTFNSKQASIAAGTTAQFYRGDKTFVTLNVPAMSSVTDGSAVATGAINETITASQASNTSTGVGSTGVYGSPISVSFTAGRWMIWGICGFSQNGATLTTGLQCGVSASSSGSGLNEFDTSLSNALISSTSDLLLQTPPIFANLSGSTTYYLNSKFSYTSGTPQHRGKIIGLRIG